MEEKKEMVNHPEHYNHSYMECIDGMLGAFGDKEVRTFCKISAFKYLWRLGYKDDEAQEIGKIKWYLDKYLELKMLDGTPIWLGDEAGTPIAKELSKSDLKRLGLTDREAESILNK